MEWTPEVIRAEVDRKHELARHSALVRAARAGAGVRSPWWRRLLPRQEVDEKNRAAAVSLATEPPDEGRDQHREPGLSGLRV